MPILYEIGIKRENYTIIL